MSKGNIMRQLQDQADVIKRRLACRVAEQMKPDPEVQRWFLEQAAGVPADHPDFDARIAALYEEESLGAMGEGNAKNPEGFGEAADANALPSDRALSPREPGLCAAWREFWRVFLIGWRVQQRAGAHAIGRLVCAYEGRHMDVDDVCTRCGDIANSETGHQPESR